jgi:hypothetical protein
VAPIRVVGKTRRIAQAMRESGVRRATKKGKKTANAPIPTSSAA